MSIAPDEPNANGCPLIFEDDSTQRLAEMLQGHTDNLEILKTTLQTIAPSTMTTEFTAPAVGQWVRIAKTDASERNVEATFRLTAHGSPTSGNSSVFVFKVARSNRGTVVYTQLIGTHNNYRIFDAIRVSETATGHGTHAAITEQYLELRFSYVASITFKVELLNQFGGWTLLDTLVQVPNGMQSITAGLEGYLEYDLDGQTYITPNEASGSPYLYSRFAVVSRNFYTTDGTSLLTEIAGKAIKSPADGVLYGQLDGELEPIPTTVIDNAGGTTWYFDSANGNDSNEGTQASPFQTMTKLNELLSFKTFTNRVDIYLSGVFDDQFNVVGASGGIYIQSLDAANKATLTQDAILGRCWGYDIRITNLKFTGTHPTSGMALSISRCSGFIHVVTCDFDRSGFAGGSAVRVYDTVGVLFQFCTYVGLTNGIIAVRHSNVSVQGNAATNQIGSVSSSFLRTENIACILDQTPEYGPTLVGSAVRKLEMTGGEVRLPTDAIGKKQDRSPQDGVLYGQLDGKLEEIPTVVSPIGGLSMYLDAVNGNDTTGDGTELNPWQSFAPIFDFVNDKKWIGNVAVRCTDGVYNLAEDGSDFFHFDGQLLIYGIQSDRSRVRLHGRLIATGTGCRINVYDCLLTVSPTYAAGNNTTNATANEGAFLFLRRCDVNKGATYTPPTYAVSISNGIFNSDSNSYFRSRNYAVTATVAECAINNSTFEIDSLTTNYVTNVDKSTVRIDNCTKPDRIANWFHLVNSGQGLLNNVDVNKKQDVAPMDGVLYGLQDEELAPIEITLVDNTGGTEWWIDPINGNDNNDGSDMSSPFRSLEHVISLLQYREYKDAVYVYFLPGPYPSPARQQDYWLTGFNGSLYFGALTRDKHTTNFTHEIRCTRCSGSISFTNLSWVSNRIGANAIQVRDSAAHVEVIQCKVEKTTTSTSHGFAFAHVLSAYVYGNEIAIGAGVCLEFDRCGTAYCQNNTFSNRVGTGVGIYGFEVNNCFVYEVNNQVIGTIFQKLRRLNGGQIISGEPSASFDNNVRVLTAAPTLVPTDVPHAVVKNTDGDFDVVPIGTQLVDNTGGTHWYIDTVNGDDETGDGSALLPWKSIQKVFDVTDNIVHTNGITVTLAPGTYVGNATSTRHVGLIDFRGVSEADRELVNIQGSIKVDGIDNQVRFTYCAIDHPNNDQQYAFTGSIGTHIWIQSCRVNATLRNNGRIASITDGRLTIRFSEIHNGNTYGIAVNKGFATIWNATFSSTSAMSLPHVRCVGGDVRIANSSSLSGHNLYVLAESGQVLVDDVDINKKLDPSSDDDVLYGQRNGEWEPIPVEIVNNVNGTTYYVNAITGNDANDGLTSATPFKTLKQAIEPLSYQRFAGDVTINVAEGEYPENVILTRMVGRLLIIGLSSDRTLVNITGLVKVIGPAITVGVWYCSFNGLNTTGNNVAVEQSAFWHTRYCNYGLVGTVPLVNVGSSACRVWLEECNMKATYQHIAADGEHCRIRGSNLEITGTGPTATFVRTTAGVVSLDGNTYVQANPTMPKFISTTSGLVLIDGVDINRKVDMPDDTYLGTPLNLVNYPNGYKGWVPATPVQLPLTLEVANWVGSTYTYTDPNMWVDVNINPILSTPIPTTLANVAAANAAGLFISAVSLHSITLTATTVPTGSIDVAIQYHNEWNT